MKGDDLASGLGDIDAGREGRWTIRDKALYAQHDAGVKDLERRLLNITHRDKTAYAQHGQPAHLRLQSPARDETVYAHHGREVAGLGGSAGLTPLQPSCLQPVCRILRGPDRKNNEAACKTGPCLVCPVQRL